VRKKHAHRISKKWGRTCGEREKENATKIVKCA